MLGQCPSDAQEGTSGCWRRAELWKWLYFSLSLDVLAFPTPALSVPAAPLPPELQERGSGPRSSPHLFNEGNKCLPVGHPLPLQVLLGGEFIAAQLQGDLKAIGVEVIEVLHAWKRKASGQWNATFIPMSQPFYQNCPSLLFSPRMSCQSAPHWVRCCPALPLLSEYQDAPLVMPSTK